jgi:3-oxoacyl-[acyl-carrier protein] reductase
MNSSLSVAILTGAASGIGNHFAKTLLEKQFRLVLLDIQVETIRHLNSPDVLVRQMDVRDQQAWQAVVHETKSVFGKIDYLFNFAGIVQPSFIYDADVSVIDSHIDINTKGTLYGTKMIADVMKLQGTGHIINVASLAGIAPVPGIAFYSASKFAVRGFSLAASYEYEPFGVTISVVCPDLVKTPMYDLELQHPEETALVFSGSTCVLTPEDVTRELLKLMISKKREICIPESRGLLSKLASVFPWLADAVRSSLIRKGKTQIEKINRKQHAV